MGEPGSSLGLPHWPLRPAGALGAVQRSTNRRARKAPPSSAVGTDGPPLALARQEEGRAKLLPGARPRRPSGLSALTSPALGSSLAGTVPGPSLCLAVPVTRHAFPGLRLALPTWPWLPPSRPFSGPQTQDTSHRPVPGCLLWFVCFLLLPMKGFERKDKGRENMRVLFSVTPVCPLLKCSSLRFLFF